MSEDAKSTGGWRTLVGGITATATAITAVIGVVIAAKQAGWFSGSADPGEVASGSEASDQAVASASGATGLRIGSKRTQSVAIRDSANPMPATVGATYKLVLDAEEESYFALVAPGDLTLIVDMRLPKNENSNLQSKIFVNAADGDSSSEPAINFNVIDVGQRLVAPLKLKRGERKTLRIANGGKLAEFWVTLLPASSDVFVPLFSEIVPRPLKPGQPATGQLELDEYSYYAMTLRSGTYRATLQFDNSEHRNTNIQGDLALLDADGGNAEKLLNINAIDTTFTASETFILTRDRTLIVRVHNGNDAVNYRLRVAPA